MKKLARIIILTVISGLLFSCSKDERPDSEVFFDTAKKLSCSDLNSAKANLEILRKRKSPYALFAELEIFLTTKEYSKAQNLLKNLETKIPELRASKSLAIIENALVNSQEPKHPQDFEFLHRTSPEHFYRVNNLLNKAIELKCYETAMELALLISGKPEYEESVAKVLLVAMQNNRTDAIRSIRDTLKKQKDSPLYNLSSALLSLKLKRYKIALEHFSKSKKFSSLPFFAEFYMDTARNTKDFELALKILQEIPPSKNDTKSISDILILCASDAENAGNFTTAKEFYKKGIELNNLESAQKLMQLSGRLLDFPEAKRIAQKILQKDPNDIEANITLAIIAYAEGGEKAVFDMLENRKDAVAFLIKARLSDDEAKTVDNYLSAIKATDSNVKIYEEFLYNLAEMKNEDLIAGIMKKMSIERDKKIFPLLLATAAKIELRISRLNSASTFIDDVLKTASGMQRMYCYTSHLYDLNGNLERAVKSAIDSDILLGGSDLLKIKASELLIKLAKQKDIPSPYLNRAAEYLDTILRKNPNNIEALKLRLLCVENNPTLAEKFSAKIKELESNPKKSAFDKLSTKQYFY